MSERPLGRLEAVDLDTVWKNEATEFTPWLARAENLGILGDTLGLDLELEAREKAVGRFSADIVCTDIGTNTRVLIENQLGRTDHTHLGQLLTYSGGLRAVTVVWIAAWFTDEHRAALDWLNEITAESFRFFGLEIQLWRIGASPEAPRFSIVSKPNDWSRSMRRATGTVDDTELSDTRRKQKEYWTGLQGVLQAQGGPVDGNRPPQAQSWMRYPIGRSGFHLAAEMNTYKRHIRVQLYLSDSNAKKHFDNLVTHREEIEHELGYQLEWEELPDKQASRVSNYLRNVDMGEESDWPRQHDWLARHLNGMERAFRLRVKDL